MDKNRVKDIIFASIIMFLILLNIGLLLNFSTLLTRYNDLLKMYRELEDQNSYLKTLLTTYEAVNKSINLSRDWTVKHYLPAVAVVGEEEYGVLVPYTISVGRGRGRIFISVEPSIGVDMQRSLENVRKAVENYLGMSLDVYDVYIEFNISENTLLDGPSAGLALTLSLISLFKNYSLDGLCITGTISPDGRVGKVGGVLLKAEACAEEGLTTLIVPEGQDTVVVMKRVERVIFPGFTYVTYEPVEVKLDEELRNKGYEVTVYTVSNIHEAVELVKGFQGDRQ